MENDLVNASKRLILGISGIGEAVENRIMSPRIKKG